MIPRRIWINLAAFLLLFAGLSGWAVRNVITLDLIEQPYRISAVFESSPGLRPNVEVVYLGVRVGTIDAVALVDGGVRVEMDIDRDVRLPSGIGAAVRRKSAVGEPYVALEAPPGYAGGGPYVEPGSGYTIDVAMTSIPLSYGELFVAIDDLVAAVPADDLGSVVHELAVALEGRGPEIRRLLAGGEDLTTTLAARADVLDELAGELTDLTHIVADGSDTISGSFDDVAAVADTLATSAADIDALLDRAPTFGADVRALLEGSVDDLGCAFADVGSFFETVGTDEHIAELLRLLAAAGPARDALDLALVEPGEDGADGPYLGGSFGLTLDPAPPTYEPRPELPAPRPLVACATGPGTASDVGGSDTAAGDVPGSASAAGELDVRDRPTRTVPDLPDSTGRRAGSQEFPLREVLAAFAAAVLAILVVATKPWRLLPGRPTKGERP